MVVLRMTPPAVSMPILREKRGISFLLGRILFSANRDTEASKYKVEKKMLSLLRVSAQRMAAWTAEPIDNNLIRIDALVGFLADEK